MSLWESERVMNTIASLLLVGISAAPPAAVMHRFHVLPTGLIENQGQVDAKAKYHVLGGNQALWFTQEGVVLGLGREKDGRRERLAIGQDFPGAKPDVKIEGRGRSSGVYNFYYGNDAKKWRTKVRAVEKITYCGLYAGIDLDVYMKGSNLEEEFVVRPGGDPSQIRVRYRGVEKLVEAKDGSLRIKTAFGDLYELAPAVFQDGESGKRSAVKCRFKLVDETTYAFELEKYDPGRALVIDPTLVFSTYLGGNAVDYGNDMKIDAAGNVFLGGQTSSPDFPASVGQYQGGGYDGMVAKISSDGTSLEFASFLGGSSRDIVNAIALGSDGNVHVTGQSLSSNFPVSTGAYDTSQNGNEDVFVAKLNGVDGGLIFSTYFGRAGDDVGRGIAVNLEGESIVVGYTFSRDFAEAAGSARPIFGGGAYDAFALKLNAVGDAVLFFTYLGGDGIEQSTSVALDVSGNSYVVGFTSSSDFPTTPGAFSRNFRGTYDGFITKISVSGKAFVYSTLFGGSGEDEANDVVVSATGSACVVGTTLSNDFPTTKEAYQRRIGSGYDGILLKLNPLGTGLVAGSYLGGNNHDYAYRVALDREENVYVAGQTLSSDFRTTPDALQTSQQGPTPNDGFLTKLDQGLTRVLYSTYLGGSGSSGGDSCDGLAVTECGEAYVSGLTTGPGFPVTTGSYQSSFGGPTYDGFILRLPLGSEIRAPQLAAYPNQDIEIPIYAQSEVPVAAIQIVLELPLQFPLLADPKTIVAGTLASAAETVTVQQFGASNEFLSIGILADKVSPPGGVGKTFDLCPGGIVAKPRFHLGSYAKRTDIPIKVRAQAGTAPIRYSEFSLATGRPLQPLFADGTLKVAGFFTRGDANSDFRVSISDIVFILRTLFAGDTSTPRCSDAADVNDDNALNLTDATYLVAYIFQNGPPPPPPGGAACGLDPTPSTLPKDCLAACP